MQRQEIISNVIEYKMQQHGSYVAHGYLDMLMVNHIKNTSCKLWCMLSTLHYTSEWWHLQPLFRLKDTVCMMNEDVRNKTKYKQWKACTGRPFVPTSYFHDLYYHIYQMYLWYSRHSGSYSHRKPGHFTKNPFRSYRTRVPASNHTISACFSYLWKIKAPRKVLAFSFNDGLGQVFENLNFCQIGCCISLTGICYACVRQKVSRTCFCHAPSGSWMFRFP